MAWNEALMPFTGVFDGNDHKISNLAWSSTQKDCIGLFGYVGSGGQIKNLGMENVDVNAVNGTLIGALVGLNDGGAITDCYSTGSVSGNDRVGGLVGESYGTITNCYSTGSVSGNWWVGGLVGESYGTITNCYSIGSAMGTTAVGGLVGESCGTITNCYSIGSAMGTTAVGGLVGESCGTITNCYSAARSDGNDYAGGLAGVNYRGKITASHSTASVSGNQWVGGMVGYTGGGTITDCYSTGSVTGTDYVGGMVGYNRSDPITDCYSTGSVSGNRWVGGLVGYGGAVNSFWDIQTSNCNTSAGGEPKTTTEMKTKSTFTGAGWDFENIWDICEGTNYPRLQWQTPVGDLVCPYGVDFLDFAILAANWYGHGSNSYTIPRGSVVVDGDISEWSENVEWIALDKVYYGSPNDVGEARFALKWDEDTNKIYVAVIVEDFNHIFRDDYGTFSASDRLELCSQGDAAGGSYTFLQDIAQQYIIAPDTNNGSWATLGFGEPNIAGTDLEYAVKVKGDLIIYEAGVKQFDNYGGKSGGETIVTDLHAGHVVRFDVVADTRWSDTGFGMLSENNMASKFRIADNIAKYTLVKQSERPPCLELKADLDRNCIVNFKDLALFCDDWLLSQSP